MDPAPRRRRHGQRISLASGAAGSPGHRSAHCGLVIEAIVEGLRLKQESLAAARGGRQRPDACSPPIPRRSRSPRSPAAASAPTGCSDSTSSIPAPVMPLVEVVRGHATATGGRHCRERGSPLGQDHGRRCRHARLHREPDRAAVLWRGASDPTRKASPTAHHRLGREGARRVPDGALRAHGSDRQRRELRRDLGGLRRVLLRSPLQALGHPAAAVEANRLGRRPGGATTITRDGAVDAAADTEAGRWAERSSTGSWPC